MMLIKTDTRIQCYNSKCHASVSITSFEVSALLLLPPESFLTQWTVKWKLVAVLTTMHLNVADIWVGVIAMFTFYFLVIMGY